MMWFKINIQLHNTRMIPSLQNNFVVGEENGNPLQYSCLGNPMDREAWQATVHRVTKRIRYNFVTKQQHRWA